MTAPACATTATAHLRTRRTSTGSFATPGLYQYAVTPYIFGETPPPGNVNDPPSLPTDIKTFGTLQTAFLADPTDPRAGGWWKQAYTQAPDLALNHPERWQLSVQARTMPNPANCLSVGPSSPTVQCASLAQSSPADP